MSCRRWLLSILLISCICASIGLSGQTNQQVSVASVQRSPFRIGVAIDESGSARGSGLQGAFLDQALNWVNTTLARDGGDAFLVGFNDQIITSTDLVTYIGRLPTAAHHLRPIGASAMT